MAMAVNENPRGKRHRERKKNTWDGWLYGNAAFPPHPHNGNPIKILGDVQAWEDPVPV